MRRLERARARALPRRVRALAVRLRRAQLRLRVMAGVVAVTLAALAAFDITAVTAMRAYLVNQTDHNLKVALTLTKLRLPMLVPNYYVHDRGQVAAWKPATGGALVAKARAQKPVVDAVPASGYLAPSKSLLGEFGITYVPSKGDQVTLQVAAIGPGGNLLVFPRAALLATIARSSPMTVGTQNGSAQVRLERLPVSGGSLVAGTSLDQVNAAMTQVEEVVLFGSLAVVAMIGAGVFLVLRRGLRPVEKMAGEADRITAGDLTQRVTSRSARSEVGRLGTALNGMLARIETFVREREASQDQVRRFFADASHELRTPLASLRANAELYQQGALSDPAQVDEVMRRIALETRRMGRLVDDMLSLSRLGQQPVRCREPVDLTALTRDCAERARAAGPGRSWRVRVADGLVVTGDAELLRRAVDNLLVNVLVHTPGDATAELSATLADGDRVVIEICDTGPGVPHDRLPHIFERFYRAGSGAGEGSGCSGDGGVGDDADARPGSGLGLAIVAEVAAAHGGTATAASRSPHGLCVTLMLPAFAEVPANALSKDMAKPS
jgi:two-component system, OmpR family, sensor kinase